jgi:hypothetical protein
MGGRALPGWTLALAATLGSALLGCGSPEVPAGADYATAVSVEVHPRTSTILVVKWTQAVAAESSWLEFTFENDEMLTSRPKSGSPGAHEEVVLGVPAETDVTIRVVSRDAGAEHATRDYTGRTGALPARLPRAEVTIYDRELASSERYLLGSVEDSLGGCGPSCYDFGTDWLYVLDRKGRTVWYHADVASNASSAYQRRARDGEYLIYDKRPDGSVTGRGVIKMTLDGKYFEEISLPISECIDTTADGSILFDTSMGVLSERDREGAVRPIWSCPEEFGPAFYCFSNTVNYSPATDTIFMAFPEENTVVEIDRRTGTLVGRYGDAPDSYAFSPSSLRFEYPHFPNLTPEGTLLVSSHMPGYSDTYSPVAGAHAFMEFEIDRDEQRLVEKWVYDAGQEWPIHKGMAIRLANGNTLVNYGTGGVIRELTPDQTPVFDVKFDVPEGDDFYNKMVGNTELIDDLYALNEAPD